MDAGTPLPIDAFRPGSDDAAVARVRAEVDGDLWDEMSVVDVQARLEAEGDFAILQLSATFVTPVAMAGLELEVNSTGLRTLEVDGTYCVPSKREMAEDREAYVLPDGLESGEHALAWSYVWNPPDDADGVTLVAPRIVGGGSCDADVVVPEGASTLLIEGPSPGSVAVALDGHALPMSDDAPTRASIPPGTSGSARLTLSFPDAPQVVTGGRWLK